jgi:hypothetical protein
MRGAIIPHPQYACMAWCLVKHRDNLPLPLPLVASNGELRSMGESRVSYYDIVSQTVKHSGVSLEAWRIRINEDFMLSATIFLLLVFIKSCKNTLQATFDLRNGCKRGVFQIFPNYVQNIRAVIAQSV